MNRIPLYKEPSSTSLRRRLNSIDLQTVAALRWLAVVSLFLFLALLFVALLHHNDTQALLLAAGILPILIALSLIKQGQISLPTALLAITLVLLITWLASNGNGIYDAGVVAFPVIVIVVGLIVREKFIAYLTILIIVCLAWLVFGSMLGLYSPHYPNQSYAQDFFIISVIILIGSNSIYLLVRTLQQSLERAEEEIEARTQVEKQREALIQELKLKNQELNRFAITVSHDLKTPLITVAGFLGYVQKDMLAGNYAAVEKSLLQINSAVQKMGRLTDEILELSRVGRIMNPPSDVDFGELAHEALKLTEGLLEKQHVRVRLEEQLPMVRVDSMRIVQVLQNLITNAAKFMGTHADPCIEIGMQEVDGERAFYVSDNGIGIEAEHHDRIFELFNKLDPSADGSGLGLALVKRIIEVHGGRIWVKSEPGNGSTFYFTLENYTPRRMHD